MRITFFILVTMFVFASCNGQHQSKKNHTTAGEKIQKLDSLAWIYQSDVYEEGVFYTRSKKVFFKNTRPVKSEKNITVSHLIPLQSVMDSLPSAFMNSKEPTIRIGAPHEYDQGAYILVLCFSNGTVLTAQIDTNKKEWPKEVYPFLQKMEIYYNECKRYVEIK